MPFYQIIVQLVGDSTIFTNNLDCVKLWADVPLNSKFSSFDESWHEKASHKQ